MEVVVRVMVRLYIFIAWLAGEGVLGRLVWGQGEVPKRKGLVVAAGEVWVRV
jgi:hypothetical protein